ncbi:MAG: CRISPR-associated endoribonuclease Cas6 [Methanobacteriaceae archaeon]
MNKYTVQGFVYSLLKNTPFSEYHNLNGFKYFSFSNIFPVSDFKAGESKNIIISSPKIGFIRTIEKSLKDKDHFYLGKYWMRIDSVKIFKPKLNRRFITSTPIVLFENNRDNKYYSLKNNGDFSFFLDRVKENALKKYNAYYGEDYFFDDNIFDKFEYDREVAVRVKKADKMFVIIGTLWKNLEKFNMDNKKFYRFLMDVGAGEKNSLGFGFLNTVG